MNAAGSCWIVVLMLLINVEAIGRSAFNKPIIGVIEMIEISVIGIVFLQLADSLRRGVLTRSDGLFNQVMARNPAAAHVMSIATDVAGAAFMGLIIWGTVPYFIDAWEKDFYIGVEGMFTAPVWPVALVIVIGVTVTMIQFLIMLKDHFRLLTARDD
jgi:TRAP-type C4-dicarboxylate transport system permease small subunit